MTTTQNGRQNYMHEDSPSLEQQMDESWKQQPHPVTQRQVNDSSLTDDSIQVERMKITPTDLGHVPEIMTRHGRQSVGDQPQRNSNMIVTNRTQEDNRR